MREWKHELLKYWFYKWKIRAQNLRLFRNYDNWCEIHDDEIKEQWDEIIQEERRETEYAASSGMDSVYWCWDCKYGDCERHSSCLNCKLGNCRRCS